MRERTGTQCLLRNKQSGLYYGRFTLHGKQKWYALETDVYSVAKLRVGDKAAEVERLRGTSAQATAGKTTVGESMEVYTARTKANPDFRPANVAVRLVGLNKVKKTGIERLESKQILLAGVFAWVAQAKGEGDGLCVTRCNQSGEGQLGIVDQPCHRHPAAGLGYHHRTRSNPRPLSG